MRPPSAMPIQSGSRHRRPTHHPNQQSIQPIHLAAGMVIAQEAGVIVTTTDVSGQSLTIAASTSDLNVSVDSFRPKLDESTRSQGLSRAATGDW